MTDTRLRTLDGFCGAGGITTGLSLALEELFGPGVLEERVDHVAINHWDTAIRTHETNHPWARHMNRDLEAVKPHEAVPGGRVHLACWAPECTFHSVASGGKPTKDQKRMQPWLILPFLQELYVENVLIENVPEFRNWGPLDEDGNRIREKSGETFQAFIRAIKSLGYAVDWRVLNAADYGDPTTRKRLFIVGSRTRRPTFPEPTHSNEDPELPDWRSASEVIDWSDPGESIWTRDTPLVQNTMQRIAEGLRRHGHDKLEPFADAVAGLGKEDVEQLQQAAVPVEDVTPELVENAEQPFLVTFGEGAVSTLMPPYLLGQHGGSIPRDADNPPPTIATRGAIRFFQPEAFILPRNGRHRGLHSNPAYDPDGGPLHTVTASNHDGHLVTPYLVQYHGASTAQPVTDPLPTQTTRDRFALVVPQLWPWGLDVRFRMLQPLELARAMGFPDSYEFTGTKTDTVRQIGNAVAVNTAKELCLEILTNEAEPIVQPEPAPGADEMEFPPEVEA